MSVRHWLPTSIEFDTEAQRRRSRPLASKRFACRVKPDDVWHTQSFCGHVVAVEKVDPPTPAFPKGSVEIFVVTDLGILSVRHLPMRELLIWSPPDA